MAYQERVDIDRLYDLIYDAQSEQLRVVTREEFEQLFGSISSFKDMKELYYDKSEVYLKILDVLKEAGVITDERYNELVSRIESVSTVANRADSNATNAIGTAGQALSDASDAYDLANVADGKADDLRTDVGTVTGGNLQSQINTVDGKADDLRNDVGTVTGDDLQTQATALRTDVGTVTGGNLQSQINTVDGKADDLRDDVGTVPSGTNLQSQITTVDGKADDLRNDVGTVTGSDLQTQVTTTDGKANQLRTDVGTVNQTDDGSLQEQITYLPAYIKRLFVSDGISVDDDNITNFAHIDIGSRTNLIAIVSELGRKTIRDTGSITLNFYISDPDNIVTKLSRTITTLAQYVIASHYFDKNGLYVIACEHLKYAVMVGDFALNSHTHTKSEISDFSHTHTKSQITDFSHTHTKSEITDFSHSHSISDVTNLQTSLNGKANSIHNHTLSDISDYTDSDWQSFPYTSYAEDFSTSNKIMYRAKGDTIVITGVGKLTSSLSANGSIIIGSFVPEYAPSVPVYAPWTGNNQQGYIMIGTNGNVTLYNRNGSSGTMSAGNYFVFDCTYII